MDRTYLPVGGRSCSLYRAIGETGALLDVLGSDKRAMRAAKVLVECA